MKDTKARQAVILSLVAGFPSSASALTEAGLDAYVIATADYSINALRQACARFLTGDVAGHNKAFAPSAAELAAQARFLDSLGQRPLELHTGILNIDYGHGRIDMRGLTAAEQDAVMEAKGRTVDGRNMATLSREALKEAVAAVPPAGRIAGRRVTPRLQRL